MTVLDRGAWWSVYRDPELNRLLPQVEINNQNVAAALAAYEQAQAVIRASQASLLPGVAATYSPVQRGRHAGVSTGSAVSSAVMPGLRKPSFTRKAPRAGPSTSGARSAGRWKAMSLARRPISALLANAKLSAQAQLAIAFSICVEDSLKALLHRTVKAYQETQKITQNQYNSGTVSKADLITAQTQVLNTQAQAIATEFPRRNMNTPSRS